MSLYTPSYMGRGEKALAERVNSELTKIKSMGDQLQAGMDALSIGAALPSYTWRAYADSIDGTANFTTGSPGNRSFMGEATNRLLPTESEDPGDYIWVRFRGADGSDGADAPELAVQWSINGVSGWHDDYADGDVYQRQSTDGGDTWGPALRSVGEIGARQQFIFKRAANQPATPANTGANPPATWFDAPPADDGTSLWQTQADFQGSDQLTNWTTPFRLIPGGVQEGADPTNGNVPRMSVVADIVVQANYQGTIATGQLPQSRSPRRFRGDTDVTSSTGWEIFPSAGVTANVNNTPADNERGLVTVTALTVLEGTIRIVSTRDGVSIEQTIAVNRVDGVAPVPNPGGSGSGAPGNPASDNSFGINNTGTHVAISDWLEVVVGSSGEVNLTAPLSFTAARSTSEDNITEASLSLKWVHSADGSTGLSDVGSEASAGTVAYQYFSVTDLPKGLRTQPGYVFCTRQKTGLDAGPAFFRLYGRNVGSANITSITGTATADPV